MSALLIDETCMCLDHSAVIVYVLYNGCRTGNIRRVVEELTDAHPLKRELTECLNTTEPFHSIIELSDRYLDRGYKSLEYHDRVVQRNN